MSSPFNQTFGRWTAYRQEAGFCVIVEACGEHPSEEGWLQIVDSNGFHIGHVHFMSLGKGCFAVDQLRPASCPMPGLSADCEQPLCLRREEP